MDDTGTAVIALANSPLGWFALLLGLIVGFGVAVRLADRKIRPDRNPGRVGKNSKGGDTHE